jgi:MurNAc alpha-1-phosphate uridylyltransferase
MTVPPLPTLAVLAGGLATRMWPMTERVPKALLEVAGEPFIVHQLRIARREGIRRVVLCVGYLATEIEVVVGDGAAFGIDVVYARETDRLLGTGGALRHALSLLGDWFLVQYGDSLLDLPFAPIVAAFRASAKQGLMTVFRNEGRWDTSNVEFAAGEIHRYDKINRTAAMAHIDYGLGLLSAAALTPWPDGDRFDLAQVYQRLLAAGELAAFEVDRRFYEIGSPEGLAEAHQYLLGIKEGG